jgi:glycosyltransferase involved in cell wall biosynthesis
MKTRFSVVVPVYNRGHLVRATIDSVLSQSFTDYELIVVDDGSTDHTPDVLRSYGARVNVMRQPNQGPEVARNRGASVAHGEYLAFLDSDDLLLPHALATCDRVIQAFDSPSIIIASVIHFLDGDVVRVDPDNPAVIEAVKFHDYLARDIPTGVYGSNVLIGKSVFDEVGGLRNSTPTTFDQDSHDMMLRFGTCGPCVVVTRPRTVAYRYHQSNRYRDTQHMVEGTLRLVRDEFQGKYPGGRARRFDRYACIGGLAWCWVKRALHAHHPGLACKLLAKSSPMVAAGALRKLWLGFQRRTPSIRLDATRN